MKKKLIIAIDGPSGAGKSTVSRILAKRLGYKYVDTGAMYRAVALRLQEGNVAIDDEMRLVQLCSDLRISFRMENGLSKVLLDGTDITDAIRSPRISSLASSVSAIKVVRDTLLRLQREMGENGGVVMEGRDIGTVVFPDADVKFFLDALPEERGKRRYTEMVEKGEKANLRDVTRQMLGRDRNDSSREYAPLKPAGDAVNIDSTCMPLEQVVGKMLEVIKHVGCAVV